MPGFKAFLGGLPLGFEEGDVRKLIAPYTTSGTVHLLRPGGASGTSGCCLVDRLTRHDFDNVLANLNGMELPGHPDKIIAKPSRQMQEQPPHEYDHRRSYPPPPPRYTEPPPRSGGRPAGGAPRPSNQTPDCMLYFKVSEDPHHKFNCKILAKVLEKQGQPLKLKIQKATTPTGFHQGWALMSHPSEVDRIIREYSGMHILPGEMHIHLERSDKLDMTIDYNGDYSWDYMRHDNPPDPRDTWQASGTCGSVILISGLPADSAVPEEGNSLFSAVKLGTLLGVYGDVVCIKILKGKNGLPAQALVEFRRPEEAANAMEKLNNCPLFGNRLRIQYSPKEYVMKPIDGNTHYHHDFSDSRGRFGPKFDPQKLHNLTPYPNTCLYLSGLPDSMTEEELLDLFRPYRPQNTKLFRSARAKKLHGDDGPKEARVQLWEVEDAVMALVDLQGYVFDGEKRYIMRVAFAQQMQQNE